MNKIWYFGDSFSQGFCHVYDKSMSFLYQEWLWTVQVADQLKMEYDNFSTGGSGMEYTYNQFEEQSANFTTNDIIIMSITDLNRTYFDHESPWLCSVSSYQYAADNKSPAYNKDRHKAYNLFSEYLFQYRNQQINFINFLYRLNQEAQEKQLKIILLFCFGPEVEQHVLDRFPNIDFVDGNLNSDVSMAEFDDVKLFHQYAAKRGDDRKNHLSKVNHYILANKVVEYIRHGISINLKEGFVRNIYNEKNIHDDDFRWTQSG